MQRNKRVNNILLKHFDGNKTAAYVVAALFAIGILMFIGNVTILLVLPDRVLRTLRIFLKDGTAMLTTQDGKQLLLDEGFFEEVHVLGKTIPCIAPGGSELIRDLLD